MSERPEDAGPEGEAEVASEPPVESALPAAMQLDVDEGVQAPLAANDAGMPDAVAVEAETIAPEGADAPDPGARDDADLPDAAAPEPVGTEAPAEAVAVQPLAAPEPSAVEAPEPPDPADWDQALRLAEALIFASDRPITPQRLQPVLPERCEARAVLAALAERRAEAPVRLVEVAGGWAFRTAPALAPHLTRVVEVPRRLPRAAMETLAIIAYHQPVTRAEIEEIRGAALAQTTLESLLEMGLIQPRGRKEVPGRPSLWGTTTKFLEQFGLRSLNELPRREELVNEPTLPFSAPPAAA